MLTALWIVAACPARADWDEGPGCPLYKHCSADQECVLCSRQKLGTARESVCERRLTEAGFTRRCSESFGYGWEQAWCRPRVGDAGSSITVDQEDAGADGGPKVLGSLAISDCRGVKAPSFGDDDDEGCSMAPRPGRDGYAGVAVAALVAVAGALAIRRRERARRR